MNNNQHKAISLKAGHDGTWYTAADLARVAHPTEAEAAALIARREEVAAFALMLEESERAAEAATDYDEALREDALDAAEDSYLDSRMGF